MDEILGLRDQSERLVRPRRAGAMGGVQALALGAGAGAAMFGVYSMSKAAFD